MYVFKRLMKVLGLAVVVSLLLSVMLAPNVLADDQEEEFDMNDRFATENGASGSGETEVDDGSVELEVEAEGLLPNHPYELRVTVGPQGAPFQPGFFVVVFGPVTSDDDGEIEFDEDLDLDPGSYRVDLFVTHDHPTVAPALPDIGNRDPLLACAPAPMVTIGGDDGDDDGDD